MVSRLHPGSAQRFAVAALFGALALLIAVGIGPTRADAAPEFDVEVHNDIEYYEPDTPTDNGNKLDLYVPEVPGSRTLPLVIWSSGSAWLSDNGIPPDGRVVRRPS